MQILYINSDSLSARQMHAEFLSYRGFVWDLTHCQSRMEAMEQQDGSQYDVVLYESIAEPQVVRSDLEHLITHFAPSPVVALVRDFDSDQELRLLNVGVHDTISERCIDGPFVMRRMRMALARSARHAAMHNTLFADAGSDADEMLLHRSTADDHRPLRLLIVESEKTFHDLGSELRKLADRVEIESAESLQEAELILATRINEFDGVLVEQGAVENQQLERLKKLRTLIQQIPFIMLILDRSDFTAVSCIEQGFSDCIVATYSTTKDVLFSVRKSLARMSFQHQLLADRRKMTAAEDDELAISDRRVAPRAGSNRRRNTRYLVERPIMAYAVLPDGAPDFDNIYRAETIDFSVGGIGFRIPLLDRLPGRNWLIGVLPEVNPDLSDRGSTEQAVRYANVILRHISYDSDGITIGSKYQTDDHLFSDSSLAPTIDSKTNQVKYGLPRRILDQWLELGVLSRRITQRAKACPDCHAVVSVGDGCSQCGSAAINFRVLIHHFACAYVDDSDRFQTDGGISCPKCLSSGLIVGADFELIKSRYHCCDCEHEGSETEPVCACFHCLLRFPLRLAREAEIYRYHVQRLDVLDILDTAKRMGAVVAAPVSV